MCGQDLGCPFGKIAGMVAAVVSDHHTAFTGTQLVDDPGDTLCGMCNGVIVHHPGTRTHFGAQTAGAKFHVAGESERDLFRFVRDLPQLLFRIFINGI